MKTAVIFLSLCLTATYGYHVAIDQSQAGTPPNKCNSKHYNLGVMNKGDEKQVPGECMLGQCKENGVIHFQGCHTEFTSSCKLAMEKSIRPFPECCQTHYECNK